MATLRKDAAHKPRNGSHGQSPYYDSGFQRVSLEHDIDSKGWNSYVHRGFPRKSESSNLSRCRDNLSRETGHMLSRARGRASWKARRRRASGTTPISSSARPAAAPPSATILPWCLPTEWFHSVLEGCCS